MIILLLSSIPNLTQILPNSAWLFQQKLKIQLIIWRQTWQRKSLGWVFTKYLFFVHCFFFTIRNPRWPPWQDMILTLNHMEKW